VTTRLVLASASPTRREMLLAAKIPFESLSPEVDEEAIKDISLKNGASPAAIADILAEYKALHIAARVPGAAVIGADQVLVCEGSLFSKARSLDEARETLKLFRGRKHELVSAVVLVRDDVVLWRHTESAHLSVRDFSDAFLDSYLAVEGEDILGSVGCYRIEGAGVQLFDKVEGDQFTIRGLPFIALLGALREYGILIP
jgi:septum formation protein